MWGKRKKAVSLGGGGGGGVGGWGGGWEVEKLSYLRHARSTGSPRSQNEIVNMQLIFMLFMGQNIKKECVSFLGRFNVI